MDQQSNHSVIMYKWVVLAAIVAVFMLVAASQLASVSPSIPIFMDVFNINATIAGLLTSVWALARIIISLPAGGIATRFGGKTSYLLGIMFSITGWVIVTVSPNYLFILVGRFVMGFGAGTMSVAGPLIISEWFPRNLMSTAMGFWAIAMPLGILWELPLIAWLIHSWGWRQAYMIFVFTSLMTAIPLLLILRRQPPYPLKSSESGKPVNRFEILNNHAFIATCVAVFFGLGLWSIYSTYIVKWCMVKGYDYMAASLFATVLNLGCVISQVASGVISDKVLGGRQKPTFLVGVIISALTTLVFPFTDSIPVTLITILLTGIGLAPITVAMFAIPIKIAKPEQRGIAMGITGIFMYASYMLSLLAGYVFDTYGLVAACLATSVIGFICVLVLVVGLRVRV
ncbi:MAG: MFS transporter [Sulfolobales archaeon]